LEHEQLIRLRRIIATRFNRGELRDLCFDLGVDYDDLPGAGKASKARELVDYLSRRRRTHELVEIGKGLRPDVDWGQVFEGNGADQATPEPESSSESFDEILTFVQQRMTSREFDEMIVRLLDRGQRAGLSKPITPAGFLDAMRTWGRLAKVVRYLRQRFPERFSG
jgi:hypothetical protein